MRMVLPPLGVVALLACQGATPQLTEEQRLALLDTLFLVRSEFMAAAHQLDADRLLSYFDADPGVIMDGEVVSRSALEARVRGGYSQISSQTIKSHPANVSVLTADVIVLTAAGTATTVFSGDSLTQAHGWTEVWVRQEGAWKILHAHQSTRSEQSR